MLNLSIYCHTDYQVGLAIWKDGKLQSFHELITNAKGSRNIISAYKGAVPEALKAAESTRGDKFDLAAMDIPDTTKGLQRLSSYIKEIEVIIRPFVRQVLPVSNNSDLIDRSIGIIKAFNRAPNVYVVGAVCCGLTAQFGDKMDLTAPVTEFMALLTDTAIVSDPGLLEQISAMGLDLYGKACSGEEITPKDLIRASALSAFAELVDMNDESISKIRKFADRLDKLHGRLQQEKRIDLMPIRQAQEDLKHLMTRLGELEQEGPQ